MKITCIVIIRILFYFRVDISKSLKEKFNLPNKNDDQQRHKITKKGKFVDSYLNFSCNGRKMYCATTYVGS